MPLRPECLSQLSINDSMGREDEEVFDHIEKTRSVSPSTSSTSTTKNHSYVTPPRRDLRLVRTSSGDDGRMGSAAGFFASSPIYSPSAVMSGQQQPIFSHIVQRQSISATRRSSSTSSASKSSSMHSWNEGRFSSFHQIRSISRGNSAPPDSGLL